MYDMHELALTNIKTSSQFKPSKVPSNQNRPLMVFQGDAFESDAKLSELKGLFLDMFQHAPNVKVNLAGLEHTIVLTAKVVPWPNVQSWFDSGTAFLCRHTLTRVFYRIYCRGRR